VLTYNLCVNVKVFFEKILHARCFMYIHTHPTHYTKLCIKYSSLHVNEMIYLEIPKENDPNICSCARKHQ